MDGPRAGVERVPRRPPSGSWALPPRVVVFGPNPLLTVTIEARPDGAGEDVHLHPGGQGVWVARMAGQLGADPLLCGLVGGEIGTTVRPLLDALPGQCRIVDSHAGSGVRRRRPPQWTATDHRRRVEPTAVPARTGRPVLPDLCRCAGGGRGRRLQPVPG